MPSPYWTGSSVRIEEDPNQNHTAQNAGPHPRIDEPEEAGSPISPIQPRHVNPHTADAFFSGGISDPSFLGHTSGFGFPSFFGLSSLSRHNNLFRAPSIPMHNEGEFSYSCSSWSCTSSNAGGQRVEHSLSAHGNSTDGHHLRETVRDGSGRLQVLRDESRPVGYRHGQDRRQRTIMNE